MAGNRKAAGSITSVEVSLSKTPHPNCSGQRGGAPPVCMTYTIGRTVSACCWNCTRPFLEPAEGDPCILFKPAIVRWCNDSISVPHLLPQTCPDSIARKWSSSGFNGSFLGTVPVLQWAKDVTLHQHQRLKQFHGAYGWFSMDYDCKNYFSYFVSIRSPKEVFFIRICLQRNGKQGLSSAPLQFLFPAHALCCLQRFCYHRAGSLIVHNPMWDCVASRYNRYEQSIMSMRAR